MTPERLAEIERELTADFALPNCDCLECRRIRDALDLIAHIRDLEAQVREARELINEIRSEAQRTIDWNQTRGMRPATDTSMFTGSYGAAVRVARMITAAYATATQPSEVDGFGDLIGSTPSLPWPCWDATPPSPEVE